MTRAARPIDSMSRLLTSQPARHPSPTVKATALAHLIFERPDLAVAEGFLTDFGLKPCAKADSALFLRGSGSAPYCYRIHRADKARFVGFGFSVASRASAIMFMLVGRPVSGSHSSGGSTIFCMISNVVPSWRLYS